jgi:hypothetical protein
MPRNTTTGLFYHDTSLLAIPHHLVVPGEHAQSHHRKLQARSHPISGELAARCATSSSQQLGSGVSKPLPVLSLRLTALLFVSSRRRSHKRRKRRVFTLRIPVAHDVHDSVGSERRTADEGFEAALQLSLARYRWELLLSIQEIGVTSRGLSRSMLVFVRYDEALVDLVTMCSI